MALNIKPLEGPQHPYSVDEVSPSDNSIGKLLACSHAGSDMKDRDFEAKSQQQRRLKEIIDKTEWYRKLWVIS